MEQRKTQMTHIQHAIRLVTQAVGLIHQAREHLQRLNIEPFQTDAAIVEGRAEDLAELLGSVRDPQAGTEADLTPIYDVEDRA